MRSQPSALLGLAAAIVLIVVPARSTKVVAHSPQPQAPPASRDGWQVPPNAAEEENPVPPGDQTLAKGRKIYESKCRRCHGPEGKGDGPDADSEHMPEDLSDASRASRNPDGVMFYKIWNGRKKPKMPAFKAELTRDEVWTVVHYAKTLRK